MKKIIIGMFLLLFVTGCGSSAKSIETQTKQLEKQMTEYTKDYYEKNIKDLVSNISEQKITLKQLKASDYDTSILKEPGKKTLCSEKSYSKVIIENQEDVKNSKYKIENHLICGKYKTVNK